MNLRIFFLIACFSGAALSTPLKTTTSLPLTGSDIAEAKEMLKNDGDTLNFAYFIKSINVFPDHMNPKDISEIENKRIHKNYYVTPFFQASEERSAVGGQELAEEGIKIIAEINELVSGFDFELMKITNLQQELKKKNDILNKLRKSLPNLADDFALQNTKKAAEQLQDEIRVINLDLKILRDQAEKGLNETGSELRSQVINQICFKLAFLGVVAGEAVQKRLKSEDPSMMRDAITALIAQATNEGQFGFRNVTYEAGYTKQQMMWLKLYRAIRPDVQVISLTPKQVFVRSTALTTNRNTHDEGEYFLGKSRILRRPSVFLAVNGGSSGVCGNVNSCNVTLEYTWMGATMVKTAMFGAVVMPIYFEADVSFIQPDFKGTVTCNFENGFKVEGRADVKDGAVIYDGDTYNKISYEANERGACDIDIIRGDGDSAAYYILNQLYKNYMHMKTERAVKSRSEKDYYRNYINRELDYQANNSQKKNYDMWSLETWNSIMGGTWGTAAVFAVETARNFYWHTRIEDSKTSEKVYFSTTFSEQNVQKTERLAFDGFTMLCWKAKDGGRFLAACPNNKTIEFQKQADTDLGKSRIFCENKGLSAACLEEIKDRNVDLIVDEDGVATYSF